MGGGGDCCNMQPICPPTQAALKHKQKLQYLMIAHLILALTLFFVTFSAGLQDLILVLILWCASSQMHFCHLIVYMLFCTFNLVGYFSNVGLLLQQGKFGPYFTAGGVQTFLMILVIAFIVFYPIAIYFCFQAYKEFKGMLADHGGGAPVNPFARQNAN